jgi:hypothetical protein
MAVWIFRGFTILIYAILSSLSLVPFFSNVTVALSTIIFQTEILPLNAAGIVVVLTGSAYYSYVSITDNNNKNNNSKKESSSTEVIKLSPNRTLSTAGESLQQQQQQQLPLDGDEENPMDLDETAPLTGKKDAND